MRCILELMQEVAKVLHRMKDKINFFKGMNQSALRVAIYMYVQCEYLIHLLIQYVYDFN